MEIVSISVISVIYVWPLSGVPESWNLGRQAQDFRMVFLEGLGNRQYFRYFRLASPWRPRAFGIYAGRHPSTF